MPNRAKKKNAKDGGGNLLSRRKTVLRMVIEKLKIEIENCILEKTMLLSTRKNIALMMDNLKLKENILLQQIEILEKQLLAKNENHTMKPIIKVNESPSPTTKTINCEEISKNVDRSLPCTPDKECNKIPEATEKSPYIVLFASNNKTFEQKNLKKVYIDKLSDTTIQEYFQIECESPLKIVPLNRDVAIKIEDLKKLEPLILKYAAEESKDILKLSLPSPKNDTCTKAKNCADLPSINITCNVIDLTDGNSESWDHSSTDTESKKRKPEDLHNLNESEKRLKTPSRNNNEYSPVSITHSPSNRQNDNRSLLRRRLFQNSSPLEDKNDDKKSQAITNDVIEIS